ncbi:MAG: thymidine kinase [Clostridia bacterium]|nr:thymidine kinase [Clostridia bacterium]MDD4376350.1 thymidine kinase [Clostridia bacterium]
MAKLKLCYGAMNAGKTMEAIRVIFNYEQLGHRVLLVKPKIDTKGGEKVVSRTGFSKNVDVLLDEEQDIYKEFIKLNVTGKNIKCVIVDEAQFLTKKQVIQLTNICDEKDVAVIAYALKNNFKGELFEGVKALIEYSDEMEEIPTLCFNCLEEPKKARFNIRVVNGKPIKEGKEVAIDGDEVEYIPVCRGCFKEIYKN